MLRNTRWLAQGDVAVRDELVTQFVVRLVDFVVGKRAVHGLVGEAVDHVLLAGFNLVAFVDALEGDLREVLGVESLDAGDDVLVGHGLRDFERDVAARRHLDRKSTRLNSSHITRSRMPSSA